MPKKKSFPKRHKYKVGDTVVFRFAGSTRPGKVIELTKEINKHATYTVSAIDGRIYPCLGVDDSKAVGNILTKETKKYNSNE